MTRRILLVEDNPDDEALTLRALRKIGILEEVSVARDGAECLQRLFPGDQADTEAPCLILLDLMLPKLDGFEVLHRIRADERTQLIPVVVLTSSGQQEDILAAYLAGANAYVRKPVAVGDYASTASALSAFWLVVNEPPPEIIPRASGPGPAAAARRRGEPGAGELAGWQAAGRRLPGAADAAGRSLRILFLEDDPADAELAQRLLTGAGLDFTAVVVDTETAFAEQLAAFGPDVILADFALPGFSGKNALKITQERFPQVPFIFLSGVIGDGEADELISQGATDYVFKDRPARLASVIRRAITEADQRAQRAQLEAQRDQSRRLESVGRLAGGVAHDFNNMVGAMLNYTEFIAVQAAEGAGRGIDKEAWEETGRDAEQIEILGQRVIQRVRQLLAVGGQELISPELIDLSQLLRRNEELLRRTLGPSIELHVAVASRPCLVTADRGQLGQVLMELAANARDVMPAGGTCSAQTRNVTIGPDEPEPHPGLTPGTYACLIVRDSGHGMEPQVLEHAFEPFFTTKPQVSGGGLGLAGVYGIISQNGGTVRISAAPGSTTVTVWLPAAPLPERGNAC